MAVLCDRDIRHRLNHKEEHSWVTGLLPIGIDPCEDHQIQPASVDLTLSDEWCVFTPYEQNSTKDDFWNPLNPIDIDDAKSVETYKLKADRFTLYPHELILCSTVEYVDIPNNIQAQVHGKSSLGRLGLLVHVTAGFIDPGFKGKITLEMYNLNNRPIILRAGKPICQISMTKLSSPAEFPYGHDKLNSKYQDQREVTSSRYEG